MPADTFMLVPVLKDAQTSCACPEEGGSAWGPCQLRRARQGFSFSLEVSRGQGMFCL